jgi:diguanylate cyclase (GGDEF)-like protein
LQEAERIIARLLPAERAHSAWVRSVHTTLVCRSLEAVSELICIDPADTAFGRWLSDETDPYIRAHSDFAAAGAALTQAHAIARNLLITTVGGDTVSTSDYTAFADALRTFDKLIESVLKELWDLLRYIDPLTGVATRYAMVPRLRQEQDRSLRTGTPCSVCMIDLDHFKDINDTYGHPAGDNVLTSVSAFLLDRLRRNDQIYRYGGEEFILVLPDTSIADAMPLVERLRDGLATLTVRVRPDVEVTVTASFGLAPLIPREPVRTAIDRADLAMYAAKQAGRNRVEMWRY